jgi:hypothetical protein
MCNFSGSRGALDGTGGAGISSLSLSRRRAVSSARARSLPRSPSLAVNVVGMPSAECVTTAHESGSRRQQHHTYFSRLFCLHRRQSLGQSSRVAYLSRLLSRKCYLCLRSRPKRSNMIGPVVSTRGILVGVWLRQRLRHGPRRSKVRELLGEQTSVATMVA